jgi:hypothetical protein
MEPLIPGLSVEVLEGGSILAYTLSSAQTTTISAWSELAVSTLKQWPKDRPYLALHDLSNPGVGLLYLTAVEFDPFNVGVTSSGHRVVCDLITSNPGWPIVLALVVSTSLSGRLTRLRIADIARDSSDITSRAFFKRSAAVEWLMLHANSPEKLAMGLTESIADATNAVVAPIVSALSSPPMIVPPPVTVASTVVTVPSTSTSDAETSRPDVPTSVEVTLKHSQEAKPGL